MAGLCRGVRARGMCVCAQAGGGERCAVERCARGVRGSYPSAAYASALLPLGKAPRPPSPHATHSASAGLCVPAPAGGGACHRSCHRCCCARRRRHPTTCAHRPTQHAAHSLAARLWLGVTAAAATTAPRRHHRAHSRRVSEGWCLCVCVDVGELCSCATPQRGLPHHSPPQGGHDRHV